MIVDDGRVFPAPDHVDHHAGSVADLPAGPHGGDTSIVFSMSRSSGAVAAAQR